MNIALGDKDTLRCEQNEQTEKPRALRTERCKVSIRDNAPARRSALLASGGANARTSHTKSTKTQARRDNYNHTIFNLGKHIWDDL